MNYSVFLSTADSIWSTIRDQQSLLFITFGKIILSDFIVDKHIFRVIITVVDIKCIHFLNTKSVFKIEKEE